MPPFPFIFYFDDVSYRAQAAEIPIDAQQIQYHISIENKELTDKYDTSSIVVTLTREQYQFGFSRSKDNWNLIVAVVKGLKDSLDNKNGGWVAA